MIKERLKELRTMKNLKQSEVAILLDVAKSTYTSYEIGARKISAEAILVLADFYNVSTDYIYGRTKIKATQAEVDMAAEIESQTLEELIQNYNSSLGDYAMSTEDQKTLIKVYRAMIEKD